MRVGLVWFVALVWWRVGLDWFVGQVYNYLFGRFLRLFGLLVGCFGIDLAGEVVASFESWNVMFLSTPLK